MTPLPTRPEDRRRRTEVHPWVEQGPHGFRSEAFAEDLPPDESPVVVPQSLHRMPLHTPGH